MSTSIPNYVSIFCDGSPSWCYTLLHNCNFTCLIEPWGRGCGKGKHGGINPPNISTVVDFLADDCTTNKLKINKKWRFSIFFYLDMTLVLYAPVKLNSFSCYYLLINLDHASVFRQIWHYKIFWGFFTSSPGIQLWECKCTREFSVKREG